MNHYAQYMGAVSEAKELDRGTAGGQRESGTAWTDTQEGGGEREEEREEEGSVKTEIERQAGQIERDEGGHVDTRERGTDTEDSLVSHRVSPEDNAISVERGDPVDDHIAGRLDAFCGTEGEKPRETGALPPALSLEGIRKKEASASLQLAENEVKSERIPETKAQKESNIQQNERGDTDEDVGTEASLREKEETGNATSETNSPSSTANPDTDQRESNIEPDEREDLEAEQLGPRSSLNGVSELEAAFQSALNAMLLAVMDEAVLQLLREDRDVVFPARPGQDRLDPGNQSDSDQDSAGSESPGGVIEKLVTGVLRDSLSELEQGGQGWGQTEPLEEREWFADRGQAEALAHWTSNDSVQLEMDFRACVSMDRSTSSGTRDSHGVTETESRSVPSEDRDPVDRREVGQLDALNKGAQTEDSTNKTEGLTRWTLNESSSVSSQKRDPVYMWEVRQLDVLAKEGQAKDIPQIITETEDLYHSASPEDIPILDLKDINKKTLEQNTRSCGFDKKEDIEETGIVTDGSLTESATVQPTLEQRQKKKAVILLEENSTYSILLERAENQETDIGMPTEPGTSENVPGPGTWDPSSCDGSPEIESLSPHDQPDLSPLSSSTGHNIRNRRLVGSAGGGGGGPVMAGAGSGAGGRSNHTPANRGQSLTYNNHHQYRPHSSQSYRSWGEQRKERNAGRRWAGGNSNGGVGGRFWENSNGYGSYSYSHRKSWSCLVGSSEGLPENSQKSQGAVSGGSTGEQSQLSYSPPSSSSSSSSLSCTETDRDRERGRERDTDRERGRERDTDRERWERERGRSVAAAPLSQDSSLGASWTLFKPPPAFPVDNSSAKTVPKISYASKVKGSNCPPAPNSQPQMLGAIFQNEWGLSFISEPGSAVVAEGGGAVLIEGAPQPHAPPSFGNGVTPDPPAPEEAGELAPPTPSFPIGCLLKEEPETEPASSDVMSEKQCRHLLDALRYHTRDPTMVVWYEDSLERPA
ncbi:UNVERIFIED_CONTAM: hypothetical protein FKN15_043024 [Acipenser sinensis]